MIKNKENKENYGREIIKKTSDVRCLSPWKILLCILYDLSSCYNSFDGTTELTW